MSFFFKFNSSEQLPIQNMISLCADGFANVERFDIQDELF